VASALVDEGGALTGHAIQLGPVRLAKLGQLVGAVSHAVLPVERLQALGVLLEAVEDVVDASNPAQVGRKSGQPVVDDVGVGVIEPGQDRRPGEVDDLGPGPAHPHHLAPAAGEHPSARHGQVGERLETCLPERTNSAASEDQICVHRPLD
jgi:hypothetical protein